MTQQFHHRKHHHKGAAVMHHEPSVLPLYPTPHPSGRAKSLATSPLDVSSRPGLEDPLSKDGDRALSHPATAISSTSQGRPSSPGSAGGPRSNAFSNQALEHYPPSSSPGAPATPTTVPASLRKALTDPSPSSTLGAGGVAPPSSLTPVSIPSDASTFTTSFTTYDKISPTNGGSVSPRPRSPTLASGPSVAHLSSLFSTPSHSNSPSPRGRLPPLVTSPTSDEPPSPLAPTPPPKSPRTLAFGNSSSSSRSVLPPAFMGSSQSKPAASAVSRSQPSSSGQRLQKAPPAQQSNQHAPSSAISSRLSPGGTTTRGRVSRSPSPAPSAPAQSQSQQASLASRSLPQPSATVPAISSSGSTNNSSSKLKRAFAGRRKKSEDATSLFGTSGASSASLAQQQTRAGPESYTGNTSANAAHKPMTVQLLGPSATTDSSTHLKGQTSRTFGRSPVAEGVAICRYHRWSCGRRCESILADSTKYPDFT
ncbi:hypothetical protein FA13DRAFT_898137 [Coprinellus micaceus]|uniref:Uncharacterized protein n=1 Tax=Coprinellus micaceus TaxID=71717 RepID=A0A4Y7TTN7_COPMI|nr:hypothetical protein FA13DRAFT_898137 [Coprinellus micaceus]